MQDYNILEINNLTVDFRTETKQVRAVNGISFELKQGRTVGVVGESGSGKSVTSLSIMNLIPNPPGQITGGEIWFRSREKGLVDLTKVSPEVMRAFRGNEIAMIFQEPMTSLNPVFTCGDQVMEAILLHQKVSKQEAKKRTIDLFNEVKLPRPEKIFDSYPHQISGGQKQRVMIAMAMSCHPSILIADEPTTALDVTVQKTILELMQDLRLRNNMSMLFITHDLGVIAEIADDVIVMYKGNIVEAGSVTDIFSAPKHPYTRGLLACRPVMEYRLKKLPTVSDFMSEAPDGSIAQNEQTIDKAIGDAIFTKENYDHRQNELKSQTPILKINGLKTYFPIKSGFFGKVENYVKAVDDVSFEVFPGETLGLVGESGCGKTTLGRTLLRLVEPTGGSIVFQNTDITKISQAELRSRRRDLQIIFQDPYSSLNPRMTVGQAIMEPMTVHKVFDNAQQRRDRVIQLLERVNLSADHFNRYPHEFSGGQRQRICIARTLALNPKFIICDESVSALDVSVQAQVLNLLNELRDEFKLTYIFISHDLSVVKFMSDRMIVMENGKVVEMGYSDDIYANPQLAYTQKLISAIPRGRMEDIERAINDRKKREAA